MGLNFDYADLSAVKAADSGDFELLVEVARC